MNKVKLLLLTAFSLLFFIGSAMAIPSGATFNSDYWTPTDLTTNVDGNSQFEITMENASYESSFGIYTTDATKSSIIKEYEIFTMNEEPNTKKTVNFQSDGSGGWEIQLVKDNSVLKPWESFDDVFGFYYGVDTKSETYGGDADGQTGTQDFFFYTDTQFNRLTDGTAYDQGYEHIATKYYDMSSEVTIYLDDQGSTLPGGPDRDFTDMTVVGNDMAPVPEPATMMLMGIGLLGIAGISRRKLRK